MSRHEVAELVRDLMSTGRSEDGARLALVIEGGVMRGIVRAATNWAEGAEARFDEAAPRLTKEFICFDEIELRARRIVKQMALIVQGSLLLLLHAPSAVAAAFSVSRLDRNRGGTFGTLPSGLDLAPILRRATLA